MKNSKVKNLAGGSANRLGDRAELVTLILTSFVNDKYYESANEQVTRLEEITGRLVANGDALFVAKAAIFARQEYGMRSITHALVAILANEVRGENWTRNFYAKYPRRVDDITEVLAFYGKNYNKGTDKLEIPNALKYGLAQSFGKFNGYQLAKYRGEDKEVSLVDAVNLLHPVPNERNAEALNLLVNGKLRNSDTWETQISASGGDEDIKSEAWATLIYENKLGYMALLKNLRNIAEQADDKTLNLALDQLVDSDAIWKSLVFPFRFVTAYKMISDADLPMNKIQSILSALETALDISVGNVPEFSGTTLIAVDESGSMGGEPFNIAVQFASAVYKRNPKADMVKFSYDVVDFNPRRSKSVMELINSFGYGGGGTSFAAIFQKAKKKYDRVIILSDMQDWLGATEQAYENYVNRVSIRPNLFMFDLAGHGTASFPQKNIYLLSGFSDKALVMMGELEKDRNALINTINVVEL